MSINYNKRHNSGLCTGLHPIGNFAYKYSQKYTICKPNRPKFCHLFQNCKK